MKELVNAPIGGDGGKVVVAVDEMDLMVSLKYPKAKVLEPIKTHFVDKLKALFPGNWDDVLIDKAWDEVVKGL